MRPSHRLLTPAVPLLLLLVLPVAALAQSFCDFAPAVDVSATRGAVGVPVLVEVKASDPNGDAITSLTADTSALPPGNNAVFTANASNTAGTLTWTPQAGQTGTFTVTYTASNALSGSKSATINVVDTAGAPFVQCPANATTGTLQLLTFDVLAGDPDGEAISSLTAAPLPPGATFTASASNTSGTFSWTPGFTAIGSYNVVFTAGNSLAGSSNTSILVANIDKPPVVNAPVTATGTELTPLSICVQATDPNGDAIVSLTASGLPTGATFTSRAGNTSGTLNWTPTRGQAGSYTVTFFASNALTGTAFTTITINPAPDRPPAVTAPATASGPENVLLTFGVAASDPDGDPITSLTAAPLPAGASFTANVSNTSGTFSWTPSFTQAGTYSVTFTASNALSGSATTLISVCLGCVRAPVVVAPASIQGAENTLLTFTVTASDPDGDAITSLTAAPLPVGASFSANASNTSGTFSWVPGFTQGGTYNVTFTASNALVGQATTSITIGAVDRAPVVSAPVSVAGSEGSPLTVAVTALDPDGDAITSLTAAPLPAGATFSADVSHTSGTLGWTPATGQAGTYFVTFTASNALSGKATTTINVTGTFAARIFTTGANKTIKLSSNRAVWCAEIEPVNGDFAVTDVIPTSVVMISPGTGSVGQISAGGKTAVVGDQDNNGIEDLEVCFLKGDLRQLFSNLSGKQTVTVSLEGSLITGSRFHGTLTVDVNAGGGGGALAASVARDVSGGGSTLFFTTTRAGAVRVRVFDVSGRMVRSLVEDSHRSIGLQTVRFDGRADDGRRLASGIYLFRIEAAEGTATGRFAVLR